MILFWIFGYLVTGYVIARYCETIGKKYNVKTTPVAFLNLWLGWPVYMGAAWFKRSEK